MMIELSAAQAEVLRALLSNRLGNLSSEIRHTDSPQFRQELRVERELVRELLQKLEPVAV